jgi:hypothetical protein
MESVVVNVRTDRCDVYVGRPSKWGNPFVIGRDGNRKEVIVKYEAWVLGEVELLRCLPELAGKKLGCWCAPQPCHAEVLKELVDSW